MKTRLVIPIPGHRPLVARLRWTTHHQASQHGAGVLLDSENAALTAEAFEALRGAGGAWIETTDPDRVRQALRLPDGAAGIVHVALGEVAP